MELTGGRTYFALLVDRFITYTNKIGSVYRKKAFTGLYTKWDSFTPRKYKINLIRTLTYRCFRICSSPSLLQAAIKDLRKLLLQNGYPQGVITFNINDVLNKSKNKPNNSVQATVPKKDILIVLPYLGFHSNQVTKRLKSCVYNLYSFVNLKIIFQTHTPHQILFSIQRSLEPISEVQSHL